MEMDSKEGNWAIREDNWKNDSCYYRRNQFLNYIKCKRMEISPNEKIKFSENPESYSLLNF
jgi:hypothetical protein